MPIKLPENLPAFDVLMRERVAVMSDDRAAKQDIRPLEIVILNLMPEKVKTETQFARLLGASPIQVSLTLMQTGTYAPTHTDKTHLSSFYQSFDALKDRRFDGLIITGAPVETLAYEDVKYWAELKQVFDWARSHVFSSFHVCWGAQAALYHHHGVPKHALPEKRFGIYEHQNLHPSSDLMRGINDAFAMPVSRHTEVRQQDLPSHLEVLASSPEAGVGMVADWAQREFYVFNHLEYDRETLKTEYERDLAKGASIHMPLNYFPDDNPKHSPPNMWRAFAAVVFQNWLNFVYQGTPYDLNTLNEAVHETFHKTGV